MLPASKAEQPSHQGVERQTLLDVGIEQQVAEEADFDGVKEVIAVEGLENVERRLIPGGVEQVGAEVDSGIDAEAIMAVAGDSPDQRLYRLIIGRHVGQNVMREAAARGEVPQLFRRAKAV
jgi:hypothetical protein